MSADQHSAAQPKIETLAIHAGHQPDPTTNALAQPIYQTTSYAFDSAEHAADLFALRKPGNIYSRIMNPTEDHFEVRINALEGGVGALATSSGAAAVTYSVLTLAGAGDNIVALSTLYGGTFALFAHTLQQFGIEARFVDPTKPEDLAAHVDERTKLVFGGESLCNPALNVIDLAAWSAAAHAAGLPFVVDNTVATPGAGPADPARRRHRGAFGDQVHRRPRHHARRRDHRLRQLRLGRPCRALPADDRPPMGGRTTAWCGPMPRARRRTSPGPGRCCCATPARPSPPR